MGAKIAARIDLSKLIFLILLYLFIYFPVYWLVNTSFKGPQEWAARPPTIIPREPTLNNYVAQFVQLPIEFGSWYASYRPSITFITNSIAIVSLAIALTIIFALYLTYLATKHSGPLTRLYPSLVLIDAVPKISIGIGFLFLFNLVRLYDTYLGLSLVYFGEVIGLAVIILLLFYRRIPRDVEESIRLSGVGRIRAFLININDNCRTAMILVVFIAFVLSWQDFTYALLLTNFRTTATVWLASLTHEIGELFGMRSALSILIAIPAVLITLLFSSKITEYYPAIQFSEIEPPLASDKSRKMGVRQWLPGLPQLAILLFLLVAPLVMVLSYWAFTSPSLPLPDRLLIQLVKYWQALTSNNFLASITRTFLLVSYTLVAAIAAGLALAYFVIFHPSGGWTRHVAVFLIPAFIPTVVSGYIFRILFYPSGPVETIASFIGLGGINWLADPNGAFFAIAVANIWSNLPFSLLLIFGAARTIQPEYIKASSVMGAGALTTMLRVVIPSLKKYILIAVLIISIHSFELLDIPFIMTAGGPGRATQTVSLHIYWDGIRTGDSLYATATSAIVAAIQIVFTILLLRLIRRAE